MKILLVAGHGASDPGAIGCGYREADLTREVVSLVKPKLEKYAEVTVYDFRRKLLADLNNGLKYNFKPFDYVLEVHFNGASATANGTEIYVHTNATEHVVNRLILQNIIALGFANRGVKKENFGVARACCHQGVNYSLLETCFISNSNDMNLYNKKKNEIATAIVLGIAEGFGLKKEDEEMTNEERVKFNEIVNIVGNLTHKIEAIEAENTILKKAIGWNSENKDEPALYAYNDDNIRKFVAEDGNEVIGRLIKDRRLSVDESGAFAPLSKTALRLLVIQNR